jgi:hypothetical protein
MVLLPLALLVLPMPAGAEPPSASSARPEPISWRPDVPPPDGYHVEERTPRWVVEGLLLAGIPWVTSIAAAAFAGGNNESGWMALPLAGPWVTMATRTYGCADPTFICYQAYLDVVVVMGLLADGIMQGVGVTMIVVGARKTETVIVPDEQSIRVAPMRIGSGYGGGVVGTF